MVERDQPIHERIVWIVPSPKKPGDWSVLEEGRYNLATQEIEIETRTEVKLVRRIDGEELSQKSRGAATFEEVFAADIQPGDRIVNEFKGMQFGKLILRPIRASRG